jgi:DNA-directed RNA polymerase specialized sigma24 family protein
MNISEQFFNGQEEDSHEFHQRLRELESICRRMAFSFGFDSSTADDILQATLIALWRKPRHSSNGATWQAYISGMARNIAHDILRSRGLVSTRWTLVPLDAMSRSEGSETIEGIVCDRAKSSDEAFALLDEQIRYDEWQVACSEKLDQMIDEEVMRISREPLFSKFVKIVLENNLGERAAWRQLVFFEIERVSADPEFRRYLGSMRESGLDEEQIWREMVKLSLTTLKAFSTFNRYYHSLTEKVGRRWQREQLSVPDDLRVGGESPYQQRWKQAAANSAPKKIDSTTDSNSEGSLEGVVRLSGLNREGSTR